MQKLAALLFIPLAAVSMPLHAASHDSLFEHCTVKIGEKSGTLRLETNNGQCGGDGDHCSNNSTDVLASRISGFSIADLGNQDTQRTATLAAEAGTFTCAGTVRDGELSGKPAFTPNSDFVARMEKMGFTGLDSDKLLPYTYLDVRSEWARSLKDIHVEGLDSDKLIAMRVFNIDPAYVRSITALGYAQPDADQLVSMRVQGVNAEEVAQIRALGYQPTLDQLIQIRIFKVTPDFIQRMRDRGFKNLTIDKLVQIRIFKLAD